MPRGHHHHHHRSNVGNSYKYRGGTPFIATPPTSLNWVIFPYDKENKKWVTSKYLPSQTRDRASVDDIERFLTEINEPLVAWYNEYGAVYEGGGMYLCLFICLIPLLPIWIFYVCWIASAQAEALKKLEEVKEKIKAITQEKGSHFVEKGLIWNTNGYFPQWIELWCGQGLSGMQAVDIQLGGGNIQMMSMYQQNQGGMMMANQQQGGNMMSYQQSGYPQQGGQKVMPEPQQQGFGMYNGNTYGA